MLMLSHTKRSQENSSTDSVERREVLLVENFTEKKTKCIENSNTPFERNQN